MREFIQIINEGQAAASKAVQESYLESGRAPLYHWTNPESARYILEKGQITASLFGVGQVCLTRDKNFHFNKNVVRMEIDGDKLRQTLKVTPFDYSSVLWGASLTSRRGEREERVHGDVPVSAITHITLFDNGFIFTRPYWIKQTNALIANAKAAGIPLTVEEKKQIGEARSYPVASRDEWYGNANYADHGGKIVMMAPEDYLSRVRPLEMDEVSRDNIDDLKNHIESGRTLDPLVIYANGKEDGRHRAHAAKELGIAEVPVILFGDAIKSVGRLSESTQDDQYVRDISVDALASVWNPFEQSPWPEVLILTKEDVSACIANKRLSTTRYDDVMQNYRGDSMTKDRAKAYHAERIAHLVVQPSDDPIEVMENIYGGWEIEDGFHRLAAAIYRGADTIKVRTGDINGFVQWIAYSAGE